MMNLIYYLPRFVPIFLNYKQDNKIAEHKLRGVCLKLPKDARFDVSKIEKRNDN